MNKTSLRQKSAQVTWQLLVVGFFATVTLLLRYPVWQYLSSRYLGGVDYDAGLYVWLVRTATERLATDAPFASGAFYPYGKSLLWSDNFILPAMIFQSLYSLSEPLKYNLLFILCGTLNGYCAYRLSRWMTRGAASETPSLLAGVIFCTFGFFQQHYGHPQLQWAFWVPLGLECGLVSIFHGSILASFLCGLALSGAFLSSVYFAVFLALALFLLGILYVRRILFWEANFVSLFQRAIVFLAGAAPALWVANSYLKVGAAFGSRNLFESYFFSAKPLSYLSGSNLSHFYAWTSSFTHPEARLFPGCVALVLVAIAFVRAVNSLFRVALLSAMLVLALYLPYGLALFMWVSLFLLFFEWFRLVKWSSSRKETHWSHLIAIFLLVFFFASLGPLGNPGVGEFSPGLSSVLHYTFPGFSAIRAVGRLGVVAVLFGAILGAVSLSKVRYCALLCGLVIPLVVFENWHPVVPVEGPVPPPVIAENIAQTDAVTIFLPLVSELKADGSVKSWSDFSKRNVRGMLWGQQLGLRVVNGYSGQRTMLMYKLPKVIDDFPSEKSIYYLRRIGGLRYVVWQPKDGKELSQETLDSLSPDLKLLGKDKNLFYLFELVGSYLIPENHIVRVPSWCDGEVSMQLKGHAEVSLTGVLDGVNVVEKTVSSENDWKKFKLKLPEDPNGVMPYNLTFNPGSAKVQLRSLSHRCY